MSAGLEGDAGAVLQQRDHAAVLENTFPVVGGGDPFEAVDGWYFAGVAVAAVAAWAGVSWLMKKHYTGRAGSTLPRTERCTTPLKMELTSGTVRMLSEADLEMYVYQLLIDMSEFGPGDITLDAGVAPPAGRRGGPT